MVSRVSTAFTDDIDGSLIAHESGEKVEFSVSGVEYFIDLNYENATEFHRHLNFYIGHATRAGGRRRKTLTAGAETSASPAKATKRDPALAKAVRQWALDDGRYEIRRSGRISAAIEEAYAAAH